LIVDARYVRFLWNFVPSAHSLIGYQAELEPMVKLRAAALAFFERNP